MYGFFLIMMTLPSPVYSSGQQIFVKTLTGKTITLCGPTRSDEEMESMTLRELEEMVREEVRDGEGKEGDEEDKPIEINIILD